MGIVLGGPVWDPVPEAGISSWFQDLGLSSDRGVQLPGRCDLSHNGYKHNSSVCRFGYLLGPPKPEYTTTEFDPVYIV